MDGSRKRKAETNGAHTSGHQPKKPKKQWRPPKKGWQQSTAPQILPGDAGLWVTCEMHKEGKTTGELRDLLDDYAAKMYGDPLAEAGGAAAEDDDDAGHDVDIETDIAQEIQDMKSTSTATRARFQSVRVDTQCLVFFKARPPVEPVSLVRTICEDASNGTGVRRCRFVKRLTPMTRMGKATMAGLEEVAQAVLPPVFHGAGNEGKKFAIRPTIRNHNSLHRDEVIRQIATMVGEGHVVDLKGYDVLILVDIYRTVLGMSVVGSDYENLKRYNLAEIYDPTPKPGVPSGVPKGLDPTDKVKKEEVALGGSSQESDEVMVTNNGEEGLKEAKEPATMEPENGSVPVAEVITAA